MMKSRSFCACFSFVLFAAPHPRLGGNVVFAHPLRWKQDDMWQIDIEWFPVGNAKPDKKAKPKFDHLANVLKDVTVAGRDCWQVALFAGSDLPDGTNIAIHAYIDKKTGWPLKIVEVQGEFQAKLISFGDRHIIAPPLEFFPVELFAVAEPGEFTSGVNKIVISNEKSPGKTKVGLAFFENDVEQWRVEQVWRDRALFWDSYEKYLKGRLAFKATAKVFELAKRTEAEMKEFTLPNPDPPIKDRHPLMKDKRLHALVKIEPLRPAVAHFLRRIKEASGVELEMAPELARHVPDLGFIQPDPRGIPAWRLMEHLARTEIEEGRWEPTATGYRLSGVSKVPPGREIVTADDKPPVEPTPPPVPSKRAADYPWLLIGAAIGVPVLVLLGALIVMRKRSANRRKTEKKSLYRQLRKEGNF